MEIERHGYAQLLAYLQRFERSVGFVVVLQGDPPFQPLIHRRELIAEPDQRLLPVAVIVRDGEAFSTKTDMVKKYLAGAKSFRTPVAAKYFLCLTRMYGKLYFL